MKLLDMYWDTKRRCYVRVFGVDCGPPYKIIGGLDSRVECQSLSDVKQKLSRSLRRTRLMYNAFNVLKEVPELVNDVIFLTPAMSKVGVKPSGRDGTVVNFLPHDCAAGKSVHDVVL
jgi:hypothetical protein